MSDGVMTTPIFDELVSELHIEIAFAEAVNEAASSASEAEQAPVAEETKDRKAS
jgi:hypothetical protein